MQLLSNKETPIPFTLHDQSHLPLFSTRGEALNVRRAEWLPKFLQQNEVPTERPIDQNSLKVCKKRNNFPVD